MSARCCHDTAPTIPDSRHRRVLWAVLGINAAGFVIEMAAGLAADSAALQADALDFLGDATNYAISLAVFGLALRWRSMAALVKGATMGAFGLWVVGGTLWYAISGAVPEAGIMGGVGALALGANALCLLLLTGFRQGDANMRSVWLCSRNDVIGNVAVVIAATGVFTTTTGWPDIAVGAIMATLALTGSVHIVRRALAELHPHHTGHTAEA